MLKKDTHLDPNKLTKIISIKISAKQMLKKIVSKNRQLSIFNKMKVALEINAASNEIDDTLKS